ncbi:MAG: GtrA family protein [Burkholderiaceae bacterium]
MIDNELVRFGVVGLVNTAFSYAIYAILIYAGLGYALAFLTALVLGVIFSFLMQGRWVFGSTEGNRFPRFVLAWIVLYGISVLIIKVAVAAGLNTYLSGALALPVTSALSYFAQKYFVFRKQRVSGIDG